MKRIKVGDLFEIETAKGKAYLHFIYIDKELGSLIRILPGMYKERPENLDDIVNNKENFMIFFPLLAAFKKNIVYFVDNYNEKKYTKPKYMRAKHIIADSFLGWYIVNTDTWDRQLVKELTPDYKELSPWGIWNDTLLIENITNEWNLLEWI